jgi:hypothetical protein
MIEIEWNSVMVGLNPMDVCLNKLRHIRKFLKGCAKNQTGKYKKEKQILLGIIEHLDVKAETNIFTLSEREVLKHANANLNKLRRRGV